MGFRIGRKNASHVYPEPRALGGVPPAQFARNFGAGPAAPQAVNPAGVQINWSSLGIGLAPSGNVQITPLSTGRIRITGMVSVTDSAVSPDMLAVVQYAINGVVQPTPAAESSIVNVGVDAVEIPFAFETAPLAIGVMKDIQIVVSVSSDSAFIAANSATIDLQEVTNPTG